MSNEALGRFTESLFRIDGEGSDRLEYVNRITGDFTLARRTADFEHVLMVGTGTGLAPFAGMVKQLNHDAKQRAPGKRYTLLHTNRTYDELAYHRDLLEIEAAQTFDFVYVPSVSRPIARDHENPEIGVGRANNVLRHVFGIPPRESHAVAPVLPQNRTLSMLQARMDPSRTVVLACGNPHGMADIDWIAKHIGMRFEKEDW